jgi:hypothetical protein
VSRAIVLCEIVFCAVLLAGCGRQPVSLLPFTPLSEVEAVYGKLITAANRPTPQQHGNGERIGMFLDATGMVWGMPLNLADDGSLEVCAPASLHDARVTDNFPAGMTIIAGTNEPNGWRGGTGTVELLLRDSSGAVRGRPVTGALLPSGPGCVTPEPMYYYRLAAKP